MNKATLTFVLHAHLPFVRHPEFDSFLEEKWLFEAINETYLPLLRVFERLERDNIPFKLTMSISPTLSSMLEDELLQQRYLTHLDSLIELSQKEVERNKGNEQFLTLSKMYLDLFESNKKDFLKYKNRILKGFIYYQKLGFIEIITTSATHAFLPLYKKYKKNISAQIQVALDHHSLLFGKPPKGFWLPECGYFQGVESYLRDSGIDYTFAAAHGLIFADNSPIDGVYAPIKTPDGVSFFARDLQSTTAVWSSEEGYPGDPSYREFYRDIGWDLPLDYIEPYIEQGKIRVNTGLKYYAITGKTDNKQPYRPIDAYEKVREHADNFLYNRSKQVAKLEPLMDKAPNIVCPFDAELFGHWWFEGPLWLEEVFRGIASGAYNLELTTPSEYLENHPSPQVATPSFSSWGNKGYAEVWLDGSNDWIYPHTHKIIQRMQELAGRFPDVTGRKERVLNQAAREVLLSQASDWPFIIKTGTTVPYATKRVKEHIFNFNQIYDTMCRNAVSTEWLTKLEKKNNLFPKIDYRIFLDQES
ncbi:glycoside hydrolase family 57 protein [Spirochaeta cellobiosiphila]|uniref:glycoside hydrolase family 57 protein n=1 Tax=Spirochaeta cellobiosiphila TaxID=504483 RepID=UPI00040401B8|nr:1,4-alpha-glucan branching protein domain-containing protein [Spirochaeta cellobiosiphila]